MSSRWGLLLCGLLVVGSSLFAAVRHLGWSRDLERRERDLAESVAESADRTDILRLRSDRGELQEQTDGLAQTLRPELSRLAPDGASAQQLTVAIARLAGECGWELRTTQEVAENPASPLINGGDDPVTSGFRQAPAFRRRRLRLDGTTTYAGFLAFQAGLARLPHRTVLGHFSLRRQDATPDRPISVALELVL